MNLRRLSIQEWEEMGFQDIADEVAIESTRRRKDIDHANFLAEKARQQDAEQHAQSYSAYRKAKKPNHKTSCH